MPALLLDNQQTGSREAAQVTAGCLWRNPRDTSQFRSRESSPVQQCVEHGSSCRIPGESGNLSKGFGAEHSRKFSRAKLDGDDF
jgi:hypothetical protein